MTTSSVYILVVLFDVLTVCNALTCTPLTANTCVKSKYVTGQCISGKCECVDGTVPDNYGCHEPFKPELSISDPESWNGEITSDGSVIVNCLPNSFADGTYRWYENGVIKEGEDTSSIYISNLQKDLEIRCSIEAYGVVTEKSDAITLHLKKEGERLQVKPVVKGMPKSASTNSNIKLTCTNVPATTKSITFKWYIDGGLLPEAFSNSITLNLSQDKFNKPVACEVDAKKNEWVIPSDSVLTPASHAGDIPGVVVKGRNHYFETEILHHTCEMSETFGESPDYKITYAWKGPDGNDIPGADSKNYFKRDLKRSDAGTYSCRASYMNQPEKISPDFTITVDKQIFPVIEAVPQKPVLGGHIALTCKVPGYNHSNIPFAWTVINSLGQHNTLSKLTDNVIQVNDAKKGDLWTILMCTPNSKFLAHPVFIPDPVAISKNITPVVVKINDTSIDATYVLSCHSDYNTPGTAFKWYIDGIKQVDTRNFGINSKVEPAIVTCQISFNGGISDFSDAFSIPSNGSVVPPVIEVEGQPPYLIIGESYKLVCSTISHDDSADYLWVRDNTSVVSRERNLTLTKITSIETKIVCTINVKNESQTSQPLEIVVKDDVKYCSDVPKNCTGQGLNKTACNGLYVCECGPSHKIEGKKCGPIIPPVIEVEGQPPYLIIGESYTLVCSTISHDENVEYFWIRDDKQLLSKERNLTLTEITSSEMEFVCTIMVGKESATSPPMEIIVKDNVKYCSEVPKNCSGQGLNKTACSGLHVCECGPSHKIEGKLCDISGARSLYMGTSFLLLLACLVIEFL